MRRCVEGSNLLVCGSYVYNHYVDCRDTNYYLSSDKINDILCLPPKPDLPLCPVLACQDNTLRALKVTPIVCIHVCNMCTSHSNYTSVCFYNLGL